MLAGGGSILAHLVHTVNKDVFQSVVEFSVATVVRCFSLGSRLILRRACCGPCRPCSAGGACAAGEIGPTVRSMLDEIEQERRLLANRVEDGGTASVLKLGCEQLTGLASIPDRRL